MKQLLILTMFLFGTFAYASVNTRKVTFYPKYHHKSVTKLCYNAADNNFIYTKKTIFGRIKRKVISRVQYNIGDCMKYKWIINPDYNDRDDDRMIRKCVARAQETIYYPLIATAEVYEKGEVCDDKRHDDEQCYPVSVFLYSFPYQIKDCQ